MGAGTGFYEWKVAGSPVAIRLSLAAIERLSAAMTNGQGAAPKRGQEVGGVLLGRAEIGETTTVVIEDCEPVECEHRRGPSYVLSASDRKRLEKVLRRRRGDRRVVGFYRSHTRPGLYLDQDDWAIIGDYFSNPSQVSLLVRPDAGKAATAGFFFWEEGDIHRQSTYLEFPLSSAEILKQGGRVIEATPQAKPARVRPHQTRWRAALAVVSGLAVFALLEYQILDVLHQRSAAAAAPSPALTIERAGRYMRVDWDRSAPAVRKAARGVLSISEGSYRKDLELTAQQLRSGSVTYAPRGNEVSVRLELLGSLATVSKSLRFADPPLPIAPPPVQAEAKAAPPPVPAEAAARPKPRRAFFDDGL